MKCQGLAMIAHSSLLVGVTKALHGVTQDLICALYSMNKDIEEWMPLIIDAYI